MKDAAPPPDALGAARARCAAALAELARPGAEPPLAPMVEALRRSGLLAACAPTEAGGLGLAHHPEDPEALMETLAAIGRADLSAGRIFEGHVNAVKLVDLHARGEARDCWLKDAAAGALFGVWGADGPQPVRLRGGRLEGVKRFASGVGVVDRALISARDEHGALRLVVLPAEALEGRLDAASWRVTGMRATASGTCDLDGLEAPESALLGGPDAWLEEPHFKGGVWRYAAVQLGAMRALTAAAAGQLRARGHEAAPLQAQRLRRMATACETARLWLREAAREVERPGAGPEAAHRAVLARLRTAEEAQALLMALDEALGAASFAEAHLAERPRRDLLVYLRQADPDGMGQAALEGLMADDALARLWSLR